MRIVLATGNPGKVSELQALLEGLGVEVLPQSFYYVPAAAETGTTFVENAIIKARNACEHTGLPAIADDSGLEVDGLGGAPGVHSARWAGEDADDAANNARLQDELLDVPEAERSARFRCVAVYLRHAADPAPLIAEGVWPGRVLEQPRGGHGFGYDPHFLVPELDRTAAELDAATKNRLSHRGQALQRLREALAREWGAHA
ncbi:RdgB/HAM1 family non-canonical purine NTP pyrophosphatase [Sediminicurvatus halobius]|uniref:dITP/XTP pyrophosphatase n=1 Tax=Sediminicurvatus halobius TaxID=2182432 RepID=A0A2U2N779_9GAMM|nr:RdgB/HAM1 family non-canonical purine NTP pyrophosphatase [Spiribacter halobius]PWG64804.1 non-canonical purine NTP pyrophosphatase, RdgB/HAM1 family [Spiribacter halobius]UEX78342.1 RdgB/HAM1 family non-canonical purine NTP pyrophosphatase [Spiribacter halobius]